MERCQHNPGKTISEQALIVNSDADDAIKIVVYTDEGQETVKGLVNSNSRGLFKLNDGHVIHFSRLFGIGWRWEKSKWYAGCGS